MTNEWQEWEAFERWGLPAGGQRGGDYDKWIEYRSRGGFLGFDEWTRLGKPSSHIEETEAKIKERMGAEQAELEKAEAGARGAAVETREREEREVEEFGRPPPFPTEPPPEGYVWQLNEFNQWAPVYRGAEGPPTYGAPGEAPTGPFGRNAVWNERTGQWEYPPLWGVDPATLEPGYVDPATQWQQQWQQQEAARRAQEEAARRAQEQQQFQTQQEFQQQQLQTQAEEAERQERARLAGQPISWLQYAEYTGEQPVVQPWMLPLMPQQYGFQAGEPMPGWGQNGGGLPGSGLHPLTRPSAQYWARMGPTAQEQFKGYRQHRTGIRPEETEFRQESAAPPGGASRLRWAR